MGDSLLGGTEGPTCGQDPSHREVCCVPGAKVRDVTERLPGLIQSSDYCPLLTLQAGSDENEKRSVRAIKRGFRALGQVVDRTGAQIVLSSVPLVAELTVKGIGELRSLTSSSRVGVIGKISDFLILGQLSWHLPCWNQMGSNSQLRAKGF